MTKLWKLIHDINIQVLLKVDETFCGFLDQCHKCPGWWCRQVRLKPSCWFFFAGCWRNAWKSTALKMWLCWFIYIVYIYVRIYILCLIYIIYIWYELCILFIYYLIIYFLYIIFYIYIILYILYIYMLDTWIIFMPWTCIVRVYTYSCACSMFLVLRTVRPPTRN